MSRSVYLDHAATTPVDPAVLEAMRPFFTEQFGNPSSVHAQGRSARFALEDARERIAAILDVEPGDVVFTSGGTEANNTAIMGVLCSPDRRASGLVTSSVEHESVLRAAERLQAEGRRVSVLSPDGEGRLGAEDVTEALNGDVGLVTLMWVNNELGTVNPIAHVARACRERGVFFHTDAVQAAGHFADAFAESGADLITISGHKIYGPKGIGALIVRNGVSLHPHIVGGSQERRRRAGTENVAGAVGLAAALEIAASRGRKDADRLTSMRERLAAAIREHLGDVVHVNTPPLDGAAPHILNVSFGTESRRVDGEMLLLALDMAGVMASSGSACSSGTVEPSHVLRALGLPPNLASATIRFSLGRSTTEEDIDYTVNALVEALARQGIESLAAG